MFLVSALLILIAYLIGTIPTGYLLVKIFTGKDIRDYESGNIGFTNVFRFNKVLGIFTLIIDIVKAYALIHWLVPAIIPTIVSEYLYIFAFFSGMFCIVGNIIPPWFKNFKGGKGVNTSLGVLLAIMPGYGLVAFGLWLIVLIISDYVSLASMSGALSLIFSHITYNIFIGKSFSDDNYYFNGIITILVFIFVIYSHRENIMRLSLGTENKAGVRKRFINLFKKLAIYNKIF
jgi:glycerol-3-phosphate acyltransferase PlsY